MRPGPKFEVTREMAVKNIQTVCQRLGVTSLSYREYLRHGSFCPRALVRKWSWKHLCYDAGIQSKTAGAPKQPRKACIQCTKESTQQHCRDCRRKINRKDQGSL